MTAPFVGPDGEPRCTWSAAAPEFVAYHDTEWGFPGDMLHTVLRRRAAGDSVEQIQPDLIIPTGKRKGQNHSVASIYRALAEYEKAQAYPEAVEAAHTDYAALTAGELPAPRTAGTTEPAR
ncbi:DNA-3-methyladenine glycosylase I [Streptomyces sp. AP-93]|uniref:DNA-3-methyladenine glycosylase I n=1 Tax=Streptomyces sp. AP-93 TaxID=2929048 RepID=UPI001FB032E0|nr:DNA-3-methyladenine glycosylase I [Streptomyces sp. AP-93]MCJ0874093.1 DNA-3-methyladenine glycosylase I [Streptomyces sp. AP-93]